jgi:hypothetical protein
MFARIHRELLRSRRASVAACARSRSRLRLSLGRLESRTNPGAAMPTAVSSIYKESTHALSVSFQQSIAATDTPVYGAVFLENSVNAAVPATTMPQ